LEKAIVKTNLEAAGATDSSSSSSGGLAGSGSANSNSNDKKVVLAGAENCGYNNSTSAAYKCLQNNISVIIANASSNRQKACKQLEYNIGWAKDWSITDIGCEGTSCKKDDILDCAQKLNNKIVTHIEEKESKQSWSRYYMPMGSSQTMPSATEQKTK
jgi:hypothetical protein